jgi:hypothetical protein
MNYKYLPDNNNGRICNHSREEKSGGLVIYLVDITTS